MWDGLAACNALTETPVTLARRLQLSPGRTVYQYPQGGGGGGGGGAPQGIHNVWPTINQLLVWM
jgi:hypothetical protein